MGSTYHHILLHFVLTTKGRLPLIDAEWRDQLHVFIGDCMRETWAKPLAIGGHLEHVHVLANLPPNRSAAEVMKQMKEASSAWVHTRLGVHLFEWQEGYSVFSVSPSGVAAVRRYIAKQEEHHRTVSFVEEYQSMLDRAGIKYDPALI